jgi:lipopolysaccharide export system protein LptA
MVNIQKNMAVLTGRNEKAILSVWVFFLLFAFAPLEWVSVSSDSVEAFDAEEGRVSHLYGSVVAVIGETVINGSEALVYEAEEKVVVLNVVASDEEMVVSGDVLTYYRDDDRAVVSGGAKLRTGEEIIYADSLTYLRSVRQIEGRGNLNVASLREDAVATGGVLRYDLSSHSGTLTDSPVMIVKAREDTRVEGQSMWIDQEADIAVAAGSVQVTMTSATVSCDSLFYDLESEIARMWGDPEVEGENGWVTGDTIRVFFEEREVVRASVAGAASGEYVLADGGTNLVRGDTIEILFNKGEMESVVVKGRAEGEYIEGAED